MTAKVRKLRKPLRRAKVTAPTVRKPRAPGSIRTVAFVSLGCPKNLVDSEKMLGLLAEDGLVPVADHAAADAIVINTCGFLEASKDESLNEIQQAAKFKARGSCQRIVVAGCLVQRHRAKMLEWCPQIDALIGVFDRDHIVEAVRGSRPEQKDLAADVPVYSSIAGSAAIARKARGLDSKSLQGRGYFESDAARLRLTPRHYAYLRISEGCNQNCSFCTIPSIRGKMRSKPMAAIVAEAKELMADGAFELNLIGQDTTSYGEDIGYGPGLVGMLTALDKAAKCNWIRLMYAYPSCFADEMIDALAKLPGVVKYVDMPLQHISDRVLDRMRRKTSRKLIETLLDKLRRRIPGMAIRTTFITGFPGETDEQHDELVEFVRDFGFDAMGVFPYSPEPGTPAGTLHARGEAVPSEVVSTRLEELMLAQQQVVLARNAQSAQRGVEFDVLIDALAPTGSLAASGAPAGGQDSEHGIEAVPLVTTDTEPTTRTPLPRGAKLYRGRTYQQAPDVDSVTYVAAKQKLAPGELLRCRITDFSGYDLIAQPLAELDSKLSLTVVR